MHIDGRGNKSKTETLRIPKKIGVEPISASKIVLLNNEAFFHFTEQIKYMGLIVTYC
jgi:hypothetical protein